MLNCNFQGELRLADLAAFLPWSVYGLLEAARAGR